LQNTSLIRFARYFFNIVTVIFVVLIFLDPHRSIYLFFMVLSMSASLFLQLGESHYEKKYSPASTLLLGIAGVICLLVSVYILFKL